MSPARLCRTLAVAASLAFAGLLQNPGFEQWTNDSTPGCWTVEARTRTGVFRETDTAAADTAACRLVRRVSGTGSNAGVVQRVPVLPGVRYELSLRAWDDSDEVLLGSYVTWRTQDSSFIRSKSLTSSRDTAGWQFLTGSDTAPVNSRFADIILRTYGTTNSRPGNRVLVDEVWFKTLSRAPDSVRLWFTPDSLARRLVAFFDSARTSIDYCCYNSSRPDVGLALIRAHNRGVRVRVITDNARLSDPWVAYLRGSGIVVWSDSGSSGSSNYMHHKFALRDLADCDSTNDWLWNSSYNPNDGELNADYALEIPSRDLCRAFRLEFEQMWGDTGPVPDPTRARFHRAKTDVLPTHEFTVDGHRTRLYFSPQDRVVDTITSVAAGAGRELGFAVNAFTHDELGSAMLSLHGRGTRVFGTFDRANAGDPASEFWRLRPAGVPVLIDSYPFGSGTVHEKIMVMDSTVTICGSANWSNNANNSNDENTLIMYDSDLAARFLAEIITRYCEAGGTYPPAVAEPIEPAPILRQVARSSPGQTGLPGSVSAWDVLGRRVTGRVATGVYFLAMPNRRFQPVVLLCRACGANDLTPAAPAIH